ncbi:lipase family protein [Nocardia macrotermitis]|uniref:Putative inactive lipase n=1 Tax=Nocardia macrotermitis TaxID=2585198 RepID=A0A7K0D1Y3_9NOCA|nr:lipase family protein [Nocardia macrotermitis]MQY19262.1 putative inactive lipase [Nocardia macrotermitis]
MGFGWLAGAHAAHRRTGTVLAVAVAMVLGLLSTPVAGAVPYPDQDPFYAAPADLASQPNGALLGVRSISVFGLPLPVSAWQLRYRTTDSADHPILDVTTVVVPTTTWDKGPRPLLSYQVPEDSLGTRCAPSFAFSGGHDPGVVNTLLDVPFMTAALLRGWALAISDYEGPYSRFLDGPGAGRAVLDGIRAALSFAPGGVQTASPVGAWGYSGGAFATLWAAQLRSSYAPQVRFAGISAGGVPADIAAIAQRVDGGGQAGLALLILMALTRNHPDSGLSGALNDRGRALLAANATACGSNLVPQYVNARVDSFSRTPDLLGSKEFRGTTAANELGVEAPDSPMYLYHSNSDDVIPVAGFSRLVDRYCALGARLTAIHSIFPTHNGAAAGEALGGMNFLADRFDGQPVTAGCTVR